MPVGEVTEASTMRFVAQCPRQRLHTPPAFGSFVRIFPPGTVPSAEDTAEPPPDDPFAEPEPPGPLELKSHTPDGTLYAVVVSAGTGSAEPGRRPTAYGLDERLLREEQPQIFDLLVTEFAALLIGYAEGGTVCPSLPPHPPRLHAFVYECASSEVCALTDAPDLVRALLRAAGDTNPDELIAATLRIGYLCRGGDFGFLVRAGKQLAHLLRDDPERLAALLRKLEP